VLISIRLLLEYLYLLHYWDAPKDHRITLEGVVVIKAQEYRSQEQNKEEAFRRLQELIKSVSVLPRKRKRTKPSRSSQRKRLDSKNKRGQIKLTRGKITE
jgi:ribosome-associated protein